MLHNPLADALSVINNSEIEGRSECTLSHPSSVSKEVLRIMQKEGYIEKFDIIEDGRGGKIKVKLNGKINKCKAIIPRFFIKKDEYKKWEKRYLPAINVGILIVSTSKGIVSHKEVKEKIGGSLIAYVY